MAEALLVMKFIKAFFDTFFGIGATIALMDILIFNGGIEEMLSLPGPLKIVMGTVISFYWTARTVWYIISKRIEYKDKMLELRKKELEVLGLSPLSDTEG